MIKYEADVKTDYRENGYIVLRGLFGSEEVEVFQKECDRILSLDLIDPKNERTPFRFNSTEVPERVDPVVDLSPVFERLVEDPRIVTVLEDLFEERAVLFKDKLILKMPGVDGYQMHQDWAWGWQSLCPADSILSVSVQIDGASSDNGCIELFPGYHDRLLKPEGVQTNFRAEDMKKIDLAKGQKVETQPGDVLIFHSLAPHQSGRNTSMISRRSLYLTYNAGSTGDLRKAYYKQQSERNLSDGRFFR